ncbi:MAG: hypothetical protein HQ494_13385 [Rhodospirillales bacterium]|nr:hypothetical protein [Rhodospirillales bacterium]
MALKKKNNEQTESKLRSLDKDIETLIRELKEAERTASELGFYTTQHFIGVAVLAVEEGRQTRNREVH